MTAPPTFPGTSKLLGAELAAPSPPTPALRQVVVYIFNNLKKNDLCFLSLLGLHFSAGVSLVVVTRGTL